MISETEFLNRYDETAFPRPSLTVDLVLASVVGGALAVLLVRRDEHPHRNRWALPGGFVRPDESLDEAAARVLRDKAHVDAALIEQLYTFGAPDRDPRTRVVTVAYFALMPTHRLVEAAHGREHLTIARLEVAWHGVAGGPVGARSSVGPLPLAFDHADILGLTVQRLRGKLDYSPVGFALLPPRFTLRALQDVHEAILGVRLNKPAFRRRMVDKGWLLPTGLREGGTSYRPAELFTFDPTFGVKGD